MMCICTVLPEAGDNLKHGHTWCICTILAKAEYAPKHSHAWCMYTALAHPAHCACTLQAPEDAEQVKDGVVYMSIQQS